MLISHKKHYHTALSMVYISALAGIFVLLLSLSSAWAETVAVRVVAVHDGDTITVLTADRQNFRVRLVEIDAPESGQPYGARAKQALAGLVFDKPVLIDVQGRIATAAASGASPPETST